MGTTMHAAQVALAAMAVTAVPNATVNDGLHLREDTPDEEIYIGVDNLAEDFPKGISEGEQIWAATGLQKDEDYRIHCLSIARDGGDNFVAARGTAFANVALLEAALKLDPSISGAVLFSSLEIKEQDGAFTEDDGAVIRVYFDVRCRARI